MTLAPAPNADATGRTWGGGERHPGTGVQVDDRLSTLVDIVAKSANVDGALRIEMLCTTKVELGVNGR
jgi:hypothetical protein